MARREIVECDRCGREIKDEANDVAGMMFCQKCADEYELFMEPRKTPLRAKLLKRSGKKRVARDCPHHVPCAEPWGCSGEEIVPLSDPRQSLDELGY
jgi:hypothetical protein